MKKISVSSDPYSPNYWRRKFRAAPEVLLDGTPLRHVMFADQRLGVVEVLVSEGDHLLVAGNMVVREMRHGHVEIVGERR